LKLETSVSVKMPQHQAPERLTFVYLVGDA